MDHYFFYMMASFQEEEPPYENMLVYPLTYDLQDFRDAGDLAITMSTAYYPLTDEGFQANGYNSRIENTNLPVWADSATGAASLFAKARIDSRNGNAQSNRSLMIGYGPNSPFDAKIEISVCHDDAALDAHAMFRTVNSVGAVERKLQKNFYNYAARWPDAYFTDAGNRVRPQGVHLLDADTLLVTGHYEDTASRLIQIDLTTNTVTGTARFPSPYTHLCSMCERDSDGTIWITDNTTKEIYEIDLATTFSSGTPTFNKTYDLTALNSTSGIEIATIGGTEYLLVGEYQSGVTTAYLYVIPMTEVTDGGTFALGDRFKRFVIPRECQGIAMHPTNGYLYSCHNGRSATNDSPVYVWNIATFVASLADGGTMTEFDGRKQHKCPSQYPEDITFHPVTHEAYIGTEGFDAVDDQDGFMGVWRSPLNDEPVMHEYLIDYDGAGNFTITLDGVFFETVSSTPNTTPDRLVVGAFPSSTVTWTGSCTAALIRDVALKDTTFSEAELLKLRAGTYEENALTVYPVSLTNPDAEGNVTTGWTNETGGLSARGWGSTPGKFNGDGVTNNYYFAGGNNALTKTRQRHVLTTVTGLTQGEIDALVASGDLWFEVSWWQASFNDTSDPGTMGIRQRPVEDGSLALSHQENAVAYERMDVKRWIRRTTSSLAVTSVAKIDATMNMERTSGTAQDSYMDDIEMKVYARLP